MGNVAELGRRWARIRGDRSAVKSQGVDHTWTDFERSSDLYARRLAALGVAEGDRVGVLLHNCVELPEIVIATLKLGAISVPLNVALPAAELAPIVADAGCKVVVAEDALVANLSRARQEMPKLAVYTLDSAEGEDRFDSVDVDEGVPVEIVDLADDAPAFICYTSGTTGIQKGAVLTHGNLRPGAISKILAEGLTYEERMLVPVALVYTGAIISCFMQITYYLGASLVLERDAHPDHLLEVIERERITVMTGVPVVYERMVASPDWPTRDISSLRSVTAGGAPVSLDLLAAFHSKGIPILQSYGMTECSGLGCVLDPPDSIEHVGFAGLPILGTKVAIMDPEGGIVEPGVVGEVCIKGPHVMAGYWNKPELTAETIIDGWLHSGDLGLQDEEGFLKIVDRKKDMVISGGHNVYPAEIERALGALTTVEELTVIGVPDEKWGEVPMLVYSSDEDPARVAEEVRSTCTEALAKYKWPRYLLPLSEPLPRTFSGKVSKPELRRRFPTPPAEAIEY